MESKIKYYYKITKFLLVIVLVVAVGVFAINQALEYRYKSVFLQTPCSLCVKLNENQSACIENCFRYSFKTYPDNFGNLKDDQGRCWSHGGKEVECIGFDNYPLLNLSAVQVG